MYLCNIWFIDISCISKLLSKSTLGDSGWKFLSVPSDVFMILKITGKIRFQKKISMKEALLLCYPIRQPPWIHSLPVPQLLSSLFYCYISLPYQKERCSFHGFLIAVKIVSYKQSVTLHYSFSLIKPYFLLEGFLLYKL